MVTGPALPENVQRRLAVDAVIICWELDYSVLLGNPAGTNVLRFVGDADADGNGVSINGDTFDTIPIRGRGFDISSEGAPRRPTVEIGNTNGIISALIQTIGGDLVGASLNRRRIFKRNLDGEDEEDPLAEWEPQEWRIERKRTENAWQIEFELSAKADVEVELPMRLMDHNVCPWTYKGTECGWTPSAGYYFDEFGDATDASGDKCGLTPTDCEKRFKDRDDEPLRFGGFVGIERFLR